MIDLAGVEYISSAGLRVLLMAAKRLKTAAAALVLCGLGPERAHACSSSPASCACSRSSPAREQALARASAARTRERARPPRPRRATASRSVSELAGEAVVLGRSSKADVVLADRFLSRQHARLFLRDGSWFLEDLGSRNTTFLNDRPVGAADAGPRRAT